MFQDRKRLIDIKREMLSYAKVWVTLEHIVLIDIVIKEQMQLDSTLDEQSEVVILMEKQKNWHLQGQQGVGKQEMCNGCRGLVVQNVEFLASAEQHCAYCTIIY